MHWLKKPNHPNINDDKNYKLGEIFKGSNQSKTQVLNAKKIDIDFDNDDFFNQFDPIAIA